jgi:hypothetical protein
MDECGCFMGTLLDGQKFCNEWMWVLRVCFMGILLDGQKFCNEWMWVLQVCFMGTLFGWTENSAMNECGCYGCVLWVPFWMDRNFAMNVGAMGVFYGYSF